MNACAPINLCGNLGPNKVTKIMLAYVKGWMGMSFSAQYIQTYRTYYVVF